MGMVVEEEGIVVVVEEEEEEEEEERLGMDEGLRQEEMKLGRGGGGGGGGGQVSDITHKFTKLHNTQRQETPLHKRHSLFCRAYKLHYFVELINCLNFIKQNHRHDAPSTWQYHPRPPSHLLPFSFLSDRFIPIFYPKTSPPFLGSRNTPSPKRGRQTFPKPPPSSASPNLPSLD